MINNILLGTGEYETVEVYEKVTAIKPTGAESIEWILKKKILCDIQANRKFGEALQTSQAGDNLTAVYNLYTSSELKKGQRIQRADGIRYEIRNVEHNGAGTILEHYKAYITRIDNQDEETDKTINI